MPRFRDVDDTTTLSKSFALSDAHELIARELGIESRRILRTADLRSLCPGERRGGTEPELLGHILSLFVSDVEASYRSFVAKLGLPVRFRSDTPTTPNKPNESSSPTHSANHRLEAALAVTVSPFLMN